MRRRGAEESSGGEVEVEESKHGERELVGVKKEWEELRG
jgi:hypothetical protein